jgi:hypothetical protein
MNREDVIRLVRENGFGLIDDDIDDDLIDYFERFAALVADIAATEEREACEAIVEKELRGGLEGRPRLGFGYYMIEAIRARGSE